MLMVRTEVTIINSSMFFSACARLYVANLDDDAVRKTTKDVDLEAQSRKNLFICVAKNYKREVKKI